MPETIAVGQNISNRQWDTPKRLIRGYIPKEKLFRYGKIKVAIIVKTGSSDKLAYTLHATETALRDFPDVDVNLMRIVSIYDEYYAGATALEFWVDPDSPALAEYEEIDNYLISGRK